MGLKIMRPSRYNLVVRDYFNPSALARLPRSVGFVGRHFFRRYQTSGSVARQVNGMRRIRERDAELLDQPLNYKVN